MWKSIRYRALSMMWFLNRVNRTQGCSLATSRTIYWQITRNSMSPLLVSVELRTSLQTICIPFHLIELPYWFVALPSFFFARVLLSFVPLCARAEVTRDYDYPCVVHKCTNNVESESCSHSTRPSFFMRRPCTFASVSFEFGLLYRVNKSRSMAALARDNCVIRFIALNLWFELKSPEEQKALTLREFCGVITALSSLITS